MGLCSICYAKLPTREPGAPGRPREACEPSTGRPCAELRQRIEQVRGLADRVIGSAGTSRSKAIAGLEAAYKRAIEVVRRAEEPGEVAPKAARRKPGATGRDARRVWCLSCGAELAPRAPGAPGRPALYCDASTGRPCAEHGKRTEQLGRLGARVVLASEPERRPQVIRAIVAWIREYPIDDLRAARESPR